MELILCDIYKRSPFGQKIPVELDTPDNFCPDLRFRGKENLDTLEKI